MFAKSWASCARAGRNVGEFAVVAIVLKGLAWDHRRCWGPLDAYARRLKAADRPVQIEWRRRSLYEFGEAPLEDVLRDYDLVVFDHPFVGDAAQSALLAPFDDHLSPVNRRRFEADSVGKSWVSYQARGKQWALPIDAAAQVASFRPDLMPPGEEPPATYEELIGFAKRLIALGKRIGLPLAPTDAMCLLLTFAAIAGEQAGERGGFLPLAAIEDAVGRLKELARLAHPSSPEWNPIACYEHMIAADDVVYTPYAFGYVTYAARAGAPFLKFANIPASPPAGSLLGGAGIGVSAHSRNVSAAIECALALCAPDYQRGDYVGNGGQPGSLAAWRDQNVNAATRGFFMDTLATLEKAYLRPTHPGFVAFFRDASTRVQRAILEGGDLKELSAWLDRRYEAIAPTPANGGAP